MVIIFNPTAGRRRAHLLWRVLDVLAANGIRLELAETHSPGHARILAREAAAKGVRTVVAAGGDGTIAEVANGLIGTDARLGIIPLGTANVLAYELGLPFAPKAVAAALAFGRCRPLWPGVAEGASSSRLFVQMLGVGFDAFVVQNLSLPMKRLLGRTAYVIESARDLFRYGYTPINVRIDGVETEAASVIISKGRYYGGHFPLAQNACPGEPGFSVVLFDHGGPMAAAMYGAALPIHQLGRAPGVRHVRASCVEFNGTPQVPAQADGDAAGLAPVRVTDAPGPIEVVAG